MIVARLFSICSNGSSAQMVVMKVWMVVVVVMSTGACTKICCR
jgi:hypothetical protein